MIRTLVLLALILGAFAGGVYCGIELEAHWMRNNPDKFKALLKDPEFHDMVTEVAKDKAGEAGGVIKEAAGKLVDIFVDDK